MKKELVIKLVSTIIISIAIIAGARFISKTDLYIKDVSNNQLPQNLITNTIAVNGEGKVFATPDVITLNVQVSETRKTTQEAQTAVNEKINQIQDLLKKMGIDTKDIKTTNISMYPEYDYRKESGRELIGYVARHMLNIEITDIDTKHKGKAGDIIDSVSQIGGVEINNISYDIEDKTEIYSQARKLAMGKASQKAEEIAEVAGVKLLKPMSISENTSSYYPIPMYKNMAVAEMDQLGMGGGASVSVGQLEFTINVNVVYGIQ